MVLTALGFLARVAALTLLIGALPSANAQYHCFKDGQPGVHEHPCCITEDLTGVSIKPEDWLSCIPDMLCHDYCTDAERP